MKKHVLFTLILLQYFWFSSFAQLVTNGSFENWAMNIYYEEPGLPFQTTNMQAYFTYGIQNVTKTTDAHSGNYAIRLETVGTWPDFIPGGLFLGVPGPGGLTGGYPFTGTPDSLGLWAKYDLQPGDTAMAVIMLTKNGNLMGTAFGILSGIQNVWTQYYLPVNWIGAGNPDTVSMMFFSSIPDNSLSAGNVVYLDDLVFMGDTVQLPNNGFENWTVVGFEEPLDWTSSNFMTYLAGGPGVTKSGEHFHGDYSAQIETKLSIGEDTTGFVILGNVGPDGPMSGIPVNQVPLKFSFYYKSASLGGDSALCAAWLWGPDTAAGGYGVLEEIYASLPPAATWTYFEVPFTYPGLVIPDTLTLAFAASSLEYGLPALGSTAYFDYVELAMPAGIQHKTGQRDIIVFPDPAFDMLNLKITGDIPQGILQVKIYNSSGSTEKNVSAPIVRNILRISISDLKPGLYYFEAADRDRIFRGKFLKQ